MSQVQAMRDLPSGLTLSFRKSGNEVSVTKMPDGAQVAWVAVNSPDKSAKVCMQCIGHVCREEHSEYDSHQYIMECDSQGRYSIFHVLINPVSSFTASVYIQRSMSYSEAYDWIEQYVQNFVVEGS